MIALRAALRVGLSAMRMSVLSSTAVASSRVSTIRQFSSSAPACLATAARTTVAKKPAKKATKTTATKKATKSKTATTKTRRTAARSSSKAKPKTIGRKPLTARQREQRAAKLVKERAAAKRAELRALPKPPKRSINAYALYIKTQPKMDTETAKEFVSRLSKSWRDISSAEKESLSAQVKALNQVRKLDYERWANSVGRDTIMKLNRVRVARGHNKLAMPEPKVKRPKSSFLAFFQERYHNDEYKDVTPVERAKALGQLWKSLPAVEKARYNDQAKQEYATFKASQESS